LSQQIINVGTANNDGTGDPLRVAMTKIQNNFSEIYGSFVTPGSIFVGSNSVSITANSTGFSNTNDTILISSANSKFLVDDRVYYAVPTGNTPIAPLTGNAHYYVSFSNTTTVKLSLTYGGTSIDITDARVTNPGEIHSVTYADRTIVISNTGVSISSNSTVNSVVNSTTIFISNSTSSANLTSLGVKVGANIIVNSVSLFVGNSTIYSNVAAAGSAFTGNVVFSNTVSFSGNVGFGNTAPNAKLQVTGTANISGAVALGSTLSVSTNTVTMGSSNVGSVDFANGYSRLPNGLLTQWGLMSVNTITGAQTFSSVTGTAFTNIFSMTATSNSTAALVGITTLSATGFTIISNTTANVAVYWSAIGK